ncbi:type I-F CRISPR-associated helicase Cas3f [Cronobacter sakazakii]|uniref:type I-F CRISPR-associated helicase Cas3f n=1 Tax=Cronobacter sakazakii TaxID=28141 RepID=UPI000CF0B3BC|nr:type I-F CRISPR-associated helicase Cas3f [Cronobacter sakazakii]EKC5749065.1 type I-F CRISPR-associated helicase Cas3 [Cronobacter sakazakii]EKK5310075.1 type I-F CRISPR-associated helicase Cas3 [Cronobacter sakazakii]EKK7718837.1 type I-F CRISPR-associated helicase Cas3 [Cronobacter sakazakii]ELY2813421.1 type I-F CRISPR-associated helicase Cas3 [Cronobacter sakazakii]ELY4102580.1 type I-F CRISPR-associated helicase Cas3 [Cronobacter sakazakii]
MNVLLISQCTKRAREESCRILDQFAERKGDGTWQTVITLEGVNTLRRLLRKSARRNTAVACHWLKKGGDTELLWVVGNLRRFSVQGSVPTNRTTLDVVRRGQEHSWHCAEAMALLAAIAGLFHDFGKANRLFQHTLCGNAALTFQPYRHEWVSVRLFQAFVGEQTDREWLAALGEIVPADESRWLERLKADAPGDSGSPFTSLPPLARVVAWLILSHHRLPQCLLKHHQPEIEQADGWLERQLNASWNSLNAQSREWTPQQLKAVWQFPHGTPVQSAQWRDKAKQIARRALNAASLFDFGDMSQLFTLHMARLALMLADHHYSASAPYVRWQDADYAAWANSDRASGTLKQKLDEHNVGVAHNALLLGRSMPWVRRSLPAISRHKGFRERAKEGRFSWQNRAWDIAEGLRERSRSQGFFGINMASTGCGKTFANARIMYALSEEQEGCRFTVALGLRTLTLQTGEALRDRLHLQDDDLAVMIGSQAVRQLHQQLLAGQDADKDSASQEAFFDAHQYVHFEGTMESGPLRHWLSGDERLNKLLSAPVLVATIDHLMPATEGVRGGRQIPAMLRLLTSDLVLDEPDDFDIADLPAVCRLVNWAGMLGSRVLLSSATLPPSLVQALYAAYYNGRKHYQQACGEPGLPVNICCAWFDEYGAMVQEIADPQTFHTTHAQFVAKRAGKLEQKPVLCQARIAALEAESSQAAAVVNAVARTLQREMLALHQQHHVQHPSGKQASLGLVRFANIDPLVAVAQALAALPSPEGVCIHYCVYHSQHPLAVRSYIENHLDRAFDRSGQKPLWRLPEIDLAMQSHPAQQHLFVVLATSVCEVGRDWDADWGIIEPSSMRSLIQFAGRIQRHRQQTPGAENLVILETNIRALRKMQPIFQKPGFETTDFRLSSHRLSELLAEPQYRTINAIPRILAPVPFQPGNRNFSSLVELEHVRLYETLLGKPEKTRFPASYWWRKNLSWNGECQDRTRFRDSGPEATFYLRMEEDDDEPVFVHRAENGVDWKLSSFTEHPVAFADGVTPWLRTDYQDILRQLAERMAMELTAICERFSEIRLPVSSDDAISERRYHPFLGVFKTLR